MPAPTAEPQVIIRAFDDLSLRELHDIFHLRDLVFVVGQKITAVPEIDGEDPRCHHAMLLVDEKLVGTARIFSNTQPVSVGRVAVHPDLQKCGYGTVMMKAIQAWLGDRPAELHAQAHLEAWYASLGWRRVGDEFMEAEIPHVHMVFGSTTSD